jgi:Zn finger protein HypA/HybF involved in hydrogenase expression
MSKRFQRRIEDFVCENCGVKVQGNGYTNHCPACLWSKHVDINPGDRANSCGGLMEPVGAYFKSQKWRLKHRCQKCGEEKIIKIAKEDKWREVERIIIG